MRPEKKTRSGTLARLLGALSLGALVSTGCTSQEAQSEAPPESNDDTDAGADHACGNGCGANGCGGSCGSGSKDEDDGN